MESSRLVEGGGDHLGALHRALHLGHLLGPLVDEQDDEVDLGMVVGDGLSHVLHHHGLARLGRRDDETTLPLADGRHQLDGARGDVLGTAVAHLQVQPLVGKQRREVLEQDLVLGRFRLVVVDLVDLEQGEIALVVLGRTDGAGDGVAGAQGETADLAGRDVDVVGSGEEGGVRRAQETKTILKDLQHAAAIDVLALLGVRLENGEDEVLLAGTAGTLDVHGLGQLGELGHRHFLEIVEIHVRCLDGWKWDVLEIGYSPDQANGKETCLLPKLDE